MLRKKLKNTQTRGGYITCYERVSSEIKEETNGHLETSENETTAPHLWDTGTAVLGEKFIAIQPYMKK